MLTKEQEKELECFNIVLKNRAGNVENEYAWMLTDVLLTGKERSNRTGIKTLVKHGNFMKLDVTGGKFPVLAGKKMFPHMAFTEMQWFMNGRTDIKYMNDRGVRYWDKWVLPDGTIGKSYGHQFRDFNGVDQLSRVVDIMTTDIDSRRNILSLWNPADLHDMALEPCVDRYMVECDPVNQSVIEVDLHVTQRSCDMFLGVPYDFMLVTSFINVLCAHASMITSKYYTPRTIHYTFDNYHVYENQVDACMQYLRNVVGDKDGCITSNTAIMGLDDIYICGKYPSDVELTIDHTLEAIGASFDFEKKTWGCLKLRNLPSVNGIIKCDVAV
jgi:thymidylate synthase